MGGTASALEEPLMESGYKLPTDRRRVRSMRRYAPEDGPTFDPTFDGYDYLIVFARPEGLEHFARRPRPLSVSLLSATGRPFRAGEDTPFPRS